MAEHRPAADDFAVRALVVAPHADEVFAQAPLMARAGLGGEHQGRQLDGCALLAVYRLAGLARVGRDRIQGTVKHRL